jgi:hypothetical protein
MPNTSSGLVTKLSLIVGLALCLVCGIVAQAQEAPASQDDTNKQLLRIFRAYARLRKAGQKELAARAAISCPAQ